MSELSELYQQVILDHNRKPRNFRRMEEPSRKAEGHNPLCGDQVTVYVLLEDGTIKDLSFHGGGCAISKASASMMTESLKGRSSAEAERLFGIFHRMVTGGTVDSAESGELGKLAVFSGVSEFPVRVKCATLAWHALRAALEGSHEPVSTE